MALYEYFPLELADLVRRCTETILTIHVFSDKHLDKNPLEPDPLEIPEADLAICAGDLSNDRYEAYDYITRYVDITKRKVIFVLGNHDYYDYTLEETITFWEESRLVKTGKVILLQDDCVVINGIIFAGATYWTDMNKNDPLTLSQAKENSNDYKRIKGLTPSDTVESHYLSQRYFKSLVQSKQIGAPLVIITHHAPSWKSVLPKHKHLLSSGRYASHDEDIIRKMKPWFWIHGHIHSFSDYYIDQTRIICNPQGRPEDDSHYQPNFTLKLGT